MNSRELETIRVDLFDVQGLLAFAYAAVYPESDKGLHLDTDSQDGLATIIKQCKERTQAAIDALHVCALEAERAASEKKQLIFQVRK